jgi:hypothetical protein
MLAWRASRRTGFSPIDSTLRLPRLSRRLNRLGNLKPEDDTLPFDFGLLEIDEKTKGLAGGSQIVETLRGVFVDEALDTFQLDHQHVFDEDIGKVFSNGVCPCRLL